MYKRLLCFALLLHVLKSNAQQFNKQTSTELHYNRSVASSGRVLTFGDSSLENHTLDLCETGDKKFIFVEDRYGIAVINSVTHKIVDRWTFTKSAWNKMSSTYSGISCITYHNKVLLTWGAAAAWNSQSAIMIAEWNGNKIQNVKAINIEKKAPASMALPNQVVSSIENGKLYLYAVLNGNNDLMKFDYDLNEIVWTVPTESAPYGLIKIGNKIYVTNWAGPIGNDAARETAGIPWGKVYTDPKTGATLEGSLTVYDAPSGRPLNEMKLGFHPNTIISSPDKKILYITNSNNDQISVVDVLKGKVIDSIHVGLFANDDSKLLGSSPNGIYINESGLKLYVANGLDNAIEVIALGKKDATNGIGVTHTEGFIPTEAYPSGILINHSNLYVTNLEAKGSSVLTDTQDNSMEEGKNIKAYTVHQELASLSIIPLPDKMQLKKYSERVRTLALFARLQNARLAPRKNIGAVPVPQRIGEPSVFKHVIYIIKENKTYDQVFGDIKKGNGDSRLCIFGENVTPNQHRLVHEYCLMDNYYASGKSSAEGHQWTDAGMVSDWVEKNVRSWFRSYPHRQEDALVYNKAGFIWNQALDHGKTVRVYGEACKTHYDMKWKWADIYKKYLNNETLSFHNTSTIGRLAPIISDDYPDCDNITITDQIRASVFIKELNQYEKAGGDKLPNLMVLSLPVDHTEGTAPDFPTPRAMVADNDLALGRIVEAVSKSRFWESTVIFVTEDDSQSGWDHVSPYRTTGLIISPYTKRNKVIHTDYNQTSILRTIEQILGVPPMNIIDATAQPMFDCFEMNKSAFQYAAIKNNIPLDEMNKPVAVLKGQALNYAKASILSSAKGVDGEEEDVLNKILWYSAKGNTPYPSVNIKMKD